MRNYDVWWKAERNGFMQFEADMSKSLQQSWTFFIYLMAGFKENGEKGQEAAETRRERSTSC